MSAAGNLSDLEFYFRIFHAIPDPIFVKDQDHRLVFANDAFCHLAGKDKEAIRGVPLGEILPPLACNLLCRKHTPEAIWEIALPSPAGNTLNFLVSVRATGAGADAPEIFILRDLTAIRRAEKSAKEMEDLSGAIINHLPNPVLIHVDRVVVFANEIVTELTGLAPEEIIGMDLAQLFIDPVDPMNPHAFRSMFGQTMKDEVEIEIRSENRKWILKNLLLRNRRIRYKGQDAILSVLIDITERNKLGKYIMNKVIETEEKDRKRFAADLHDDLGPTLSSIKLQLGVLQESLGEGGLAEPLRACSTQLSEAISKMRVIANNLMPRLIEKYGLESALNAFISTVRAEGRFEVDFRSNMGPARMPGEIEMHLYRIICELLNNTLKHSGASRATIRLSWSKESLKIFYTDNGTGYDLEEITRKTGGMGLSNILNRVNLIDGDIRFVRKKGKTEVRIMKEL
jgi:PAS domain S-box-containing protein